MLDITPDDIANLSDEDLRSLVGLLCEADLRRQGLSASATIWGGNQNAADGGIDVRVALPSSATIAGFIPRPSTGFQVKKTDFTPALIGPEMRPSGMLRPSILALSQESGAYIIASSGTNASDSALADRIAAMRATLGDTAAANALHLDFYDRSRLATWVREHPGLILWIRKRIGRAISGWRPYEPWAFSPDGLKDEYLTDDKARLHAGMRDEIGISIDDGIQRMRDVLGKPRGIVRLAGLSGVGKTRLVQALFDARIGISSLDPAMAIYADMSDNPDPQPTGMAHDLIAMRKRAIVIVDNCAPDLHKRLSELCRNADSTVSVITVEYDIQDDEPEGTEVFRLEPSTPRLVADLIVRRFPKLSKVDAETIGNFSGGNARVAIALANTLEKDETLAGLRDEELFRRLFNQRQTPDGDLLSAAQACALLYSFQGETLSGEAAELPALASLVDMTAAQLFAKVATLKQRDLVQRRGEWRAVLPHAIANRLAVMALKTIPLELIESQFTTDRMMRSFSRRLGYLHESEEAARVVEKWLGADGMLANVAQLNDLGLAMFTNIAPVTPAATLNAIENALNGPQAANIKTQGVQRDKIAHLLRSLAYDAALFDRSAGSLIALADDDKAETRTHPVVDAVVSLFHLYLSGTHATVEQRVAIVERLLRSDNAQRQALGRKLLEAMLQAGQFSSAYLFEFGARPRDYGYWPKLYSDEQHWYETVLNKARSLAASDPGLAKVIRSAVAKALRGLWYRNANLRPLIEAMCRDFVATDFWQEGWIAVRMILAYPSDKTPEEALGQLRKLEILLRPKNIVEQVRAVVLSGTANAVDLEDMDDDEEAEGEKKTPRPSYERANDVAEELGRSVAADRALFTILLPDLVRGEGGRLPSFGKGLALATTDKRALWNLFAQALAEVPTGERNVGAFIGLLMGTNVDDPTLCEALLEDALEHPTLATWFPVLQTSVPITAQGAARLKRALTLGKAPVGQFRFLGWGRASDAISAPDLKDLLVAIAAKPKGFGIALDVLSMRLHSEKDSGEKYPAELLAAGRALLANVVFEDHDNMLDYHLRMAVNACLKGVDGEEAARKLCIKFKEAVSSYAIHTFSYDQLLQGLFHTQPQVALNIFFAGATNLSGEFVESDTFDDPSEHRKNALDVVPDDEILDWCRDGSSSRYSTIAKAVTYCRGTDWTPIARRLLEVAPDPVAVLGIFVDRFPPRSWSGSRASIMETRVRLLDELIEHPNPAIAALAKQKLPELEAQISREREYENERDRGRDERFE